MTTEDQIRALFTRRNAAFERHDAAALAADYADDCVLVSAFAGTVVGRPAIEKVFRSFFGAFPDVTFQLEDVLIFGEQVVQLVTNRGTDTGGFLGQAPTGKLCSVFLVFVITLRNQQIVHERRIYDFNGLLLQLAGNSDVSLEGSRLYQAALDRAKMEREVSLAGKIQQALLPKRQHAGAGFEVAAASIPCRAIGGDFFDYFDLANGEFGLVLGDVAGKGPPSALLAAVLQGIFASHSSLCGTPAETLVHVNEVLVRRAVASRFATVLYGVLSRDGRFTYSNAGHNPPLLVGPRGVQRLRTGGLIIGAFEHARFDEETVQLEPDDVLVIFSDGITEAFNSDGEDFGDERLVSCVQASRDLEPPALVEHLLDAVHQFTGGAEQSDDLTLFILRYADTRIAAA